MGQKIKELETTASANGIREPSNLIQEGMCLVIGSTTSNTMMVMKKLVYSLSVNTNSYKAIKE